MYASGVPFGILIDTKGPRWSVMIGAISLACGYFPLWSAYNNGPGSMSVGTLSFFSFLTGMGSCSAFSGAIKVSASNWPHHRGTATAFPLSGFGLSAFVFTMISTFAFPDDTSRFLLMLAIGTFGLVFVGMLFLRMIPPTSPYQAIPTEEGGRPNHPRKNSSELQKSVSKHGRHGSIDEPGTFPSSSTSSCLHHMYKYMNMLPTQHHTVIPSANDVDETSSLLSTSSDTPDKSTTDPQDDHPHSHKPDITGWALLKTGSFWKLFILLGLLCGVGLMTINNIGNNAKTLWHHFDQNAGHDFIQSKQLMHVSILSLASFVGRLSSGIGSDVVVKKLHSSRYWSLVASSLIFVLAQICGLSIENPIYLFLLSGLSGLGYGALFGVFPALVADAFGAKGLGINWGAMTMSPVISGNIFNLAYGTILDSHSGPIEGHDRLCRDGKSCYSAAYSITLVASVIGVAWSLWCVWHEAREKRRASKESITAHDA